MEPAGHVVGVVGLAGLFSTCIDCFHLVRSGRYLGRDYLILETKYNNQHLRLSAWGRACGFTDANDSGGLPLEWSDDVRSAVSETLLRIAALLQDHRALSRRYGLSRREPNASMSVMSGALDSLARRFRAPPVKRPAVQAAVQWAIADKDKFAELVVHLKDFIDDLEDLTSDLTVPPRQRRFIQVEVESICDESELEVIEQARIGRRDPVADAASLRLSQLQSARTISPSGPAEDAEWEVIPQTASSLGCPLEAYRQILYTTLHTGMVLQPPYDWFYYNRDELTESLCIRPSTESFSVAENLLLFVQDLMAEDYRRVSDCVGASTVASVPWKLFPLIFRPGELIIEKRPDGDDDFRAYIQAGFPRLVWMADPEPQEVLEIPVATMHDERDSSTLRIQRSVFELEGGILADLPIIPKFFERDCDDEYLYNRGLKFSSLRWPQLVTYAGELGEYHERRRYTMCNPHAVHRFHLRDHFWRKLLVRNINFPSESTTSFESEDPEIESETMHQFRELLKLMKRRRWSGGPRKRIIVSLQGSCVGDAVASASRMTNRALYRIRLADRTENLDAIFRMAETLNDSWGCIILIEDIIEATKCLSTLEALEVLRPVHHFIEGYMGIVVFLLPNNPWDRLRLDSLMAQRFCIHFVFESLDRSADRRIKLWQQLIANLCNHRWTVTEDNGRLSETAHILGEWKVTEEEIVSIVDSVWCLPIDNPDSQTIYQLLHARLALSSAKANKATSKEIQDLEAQEAALIYRYRVRDDRDIVYRDLKWHLIDAKS
ncbi:hypothetical protein MFIFM68171_06336 [Madurella fahalii]|uniref:Prion-inhibition and propagation HeLo domain-containing protein n=1 Tax=Madurella fahalii TaxID=1157608 RepID=A0ABQ0GED5_9PEZI